MGIYLDESFHSVKPSSNKHYNARKVQFVKKHLSAVNLIIKKGRFEHLPFFIYSFRSKLLVLFPFFKLLGSYIAAKNLRKC